MKTLLPLLLVGALLVAGACASTQANTPRKNPDLITLEEIEASGLAFVDAYDVVKHFEPQWLRKRGTVNLMPDAGLIDYVVVYEDGIRLGDPDALRGISAHSIREVQYYNTAQAVRFGPPDHPHGAIFVRTKSR